MHGPYILAILEGLCMIDDMWWPVRSVTEWKRLRWSFLMLMRWGDVKRSEALQLGRNRYTCSTKLKGNANWCGNVYKIDQSIGLSGFFIMVNVAKDEYHHLVTATRAHTKGDFDHTSPHWSFQVLLMSSLWEASVISRKTWWSDADQKTADLSCDFQLLAFHPHGFWS